MLLVLFGFAHQLSFRQVDPAWGMDAEVAAMKAAHFDVLGVNRTYWDFFSGFGFIFTVTLFFAAVLAFQLGGLSRESLRDLGLVRWGFGVSFAVITVLMWRYFFVVPLIFSALAALFLLLAAWSAARA